MFDIHLIMFQVTYTFYCFNLKTSSHSFDFILFDFSVNKPSSEINCNQSPPEGALSIMEPKTKESKYKFLTMH